MKRVHITSLGCPKNLVDTEVMIGLLEKEGWLIVEEPQDCDVMLINTCGFIQPAVEEGVEQILELAQVKEEYHKIKLVVTGCMVQRYGETLKKEIPEIDLLLGTEAVPDITRMLKKLIQGDNSITVYSPGLFLMDSSLSRRLVTPFYRAWMKITEGCNNCCSYCMIPSIRGNLRSRPIEDLVLEAQKLEKGGVKELCLIAQDLTAYGMDMTGRAEIVELVKQLIQQTTIPWLRLMYLYPTGITDDILSLMARNSRVVPYLDIPFQHVSTDVLHRMNRRYTRDDIYALIEKVRSYIPEVALRTTFLLGFPGETEADVALVEEFLRKIRLDHVGIFAYANEEGCPSEFFPGQIDEEEKACRVDHIMSVQASISEDIQKKYVGRVEQVIVEGVSKETELLLEGRTRYQAPEIDGCVYINDGTAEVGAIVDVEISESQTYDLVGAIVGESI